MPNDHQRNIIDASDIPLGAELVAECGAYPDEALRLATRIREKRPAYVVRTGTRYAVWAEYNQKPWPQLI